MERPEVLCKDKIDPVNPEEDEEVSIVIFAKGTCPIIPCADEESFRSPGMWGKCTSKLNEDGIDFCTPCPYSRYSCVPWAQRAPGKDTELPKDIWRVGKVSRCLCLDFDGERDPRVDGKCSPPRV